MSTYKKKKKSHFVVENIFILVFFDDTEQLSQLIWHTSVTRTNFSSPAQNTPDIPALSAASFPVLIRTCNESSVQGTKTNHFSFCRAIFYLSSLNKSNEYQTKKKGGGADGLNSYAITLKPNLFKVPLLQANTKNNLCGVLIQV